MSRPSGTWLVAALGMAIVFLIANGTIAYRSTRTLAAYERQIAHTQETLGQLQAVQASMADAETGQRGYLLLGDESYLAPYIVARGQLTARLDRLRALTADNPAQQARLDRLAVLVPIRLDVMSQTIALRQQGQEAAALQIVRNGTGKQAMDELRTIVEAMNAEEDALLAQRTATAAAARETTARAIGAATLGEVVLLGALAILFWRDLSRREQAARERAALLVQEREARATAETAVQLRDQFLGIASHELKNPLTVLQGSAQLLALRLGKRADLSERERRMLGMLGEQTTRMRRLIDTMLDVSRIDGGRLAIERAPLDLGPLVSRIVEEAALPFDTARIVLDCAPVPLAVAGDALRLEQVIQNLLQNALRYSADDTTVRVRVGRDGARAIVAVEDRGIGIPADALPRIFERFYRATRDGAQRGGMGIGLFVVREIVALHGGTIAVESVEGAGSTFTVALPLADPAALEPAAAVANAAHPRPAGCEAELDRQLPADAPADHDRRAG